MLGLSAPNSAPCSLGRGFFNFISRASLAFAKCKTARDHRTTEITARRTAARLAGRIVHETGHGVTPDETR